MKPILRVYAVCVFACGVLRPEIAIHLIVFATCTVEFVLSLGDLWDLFLGTTR